MTERPILFSAPMVRAILAGRKTQTRRVAKGFPCGLIFHDDRLRQWDGKAWRDCPYGVAGDRLWVRETFYERFDGLDDVRLDGFAADGEKKTGSVPATAYEAMTEGSRVKRPSIFMPRKYSRITLEIVKVRVERLQEISEADAIAEGCPGHEREISQTASAWIRPEWEYRDLWDSLNAERGFGWAVNPWLWVVEFRRLEAPRG